MGSKAKTVASADRRQQKKAAQQKEELLDSTREQEIRNRAYEIYLQRGGQPGDEVDDWLQAERELAS
jgi:hypothetical protein